MHRTIHRLLLTSAFTPTAATLTHPRTRTPAAAIIVSSLSRTLASTSTSSSPPRKTLPRSNSFTDSLSGAAVTTGTGITDAFTTKSAETAVNDILYGFPQLGAKKDTSRHILSVLVDNEPGVLSKVSGMLSARGFNIESLSVCATDVSDLSRMTIVLDCSDKAMAQARHQLEDLVNVWAVLDLMPRHAVERELLLCKLDCVAPSLRAARATAAAATEKDTGAAAATAKTTITPDQAAQSAHSQRKTISEIVSFFDGKVINVGTEHVIVQVVNTSEKINALLTLLRPFGIIEAVRSGSLAMSKSIVTGLFDESESQPHVTTIDEANLPPG